MKTKLLILIIIIFTLLSCRKQPLHKGYVVISPEIAEIMVALNGDGDIIGVAEECNYPDILKTKTKVGNFGQISLEKIIKLNPEYVITSSLEQEAIAKELEKLGIKVISYYPKSLKEMIQVIGEIGVLTNSQKRATALQDQLKESIEELRVSQPNFKRKVLIEIYSDPLMSASDSSFVGELLTLAGGQNIFPKLERDYCRIKNEDAIIANPDVIIITYPGMTKEMVKYRKGWQKINAVRNNRIYTPDQINPDLILRATPRCLEGVKQLREKIYE